MEHNNLTNILHKHFLWSTTCSYILYRWSYNKVHYLTSHVKALQNRNNLSCMVHNVHMWPSLVNTWVVGDNKFKTKVSNINLAA
jgi:hypothetical protein